MSSTSLPLVDLAVFGIVLVSALFAAVRGFTHEIFAIGGWVAAVLAVVFGLPLVRPIARGFISTHWIADVAGAAVLFIVTLVVMAVLTRSISHGVRDSALSPVDRALGFAFGALRGAFLIVIAYIGMMWVLDSPTQPGWMRDAKTAPWIAAGASIVRGWIPASLLDSDASHQAQDAKQTARDAMALEKTLRDWSAPEPQAKAAAKGDAANDGYGEDQRREMNRLIDANR